MSKTNRAIVVTMLKNPSHSAFIQFYVSCLRDSTGINSISCFTPTKSVKSTLMQDSYTNLPTWLEDSTKLLSEEKCLGESVALLTPEVFERIIQSLSQKDLKLIRLLVRLDTQSKMDMHSKKTFECSKEKLDLLRWRRCLLCLWR